VARKNNERFFLQKVLYNPPFSELKLDFKRNSFQVCRRAANLHLANSMAVRYAQLRWTLKPAQKGYMLCQSWQKAELMAATVLAVGHSLVMKFPNFLIKGDSGFL